MTRFGHIALAAIAAVGMLVLASCQKNERPFVVSKIQAAAKLATCETTIDKIVLATEQKRVIKWLGGKKQAVFLAYLIEILWGKDFALFPFGWPRRS